MDTKRIEFVDFEVVDLVLNDDFRQLVLGNEADQALQEMFVKYPEFKDNFILASKIVLGMQKKRQEHSLDKKYNLWVNILHDYRRKKILGILRYAAVFFLLVSLSTGALFYANRESEITKYAETAEIDFNRSKLILTDGENIILSENEPQLQYADDGKSIILNDSTRINQSRDGFNQMIVPHGKRSKILLSDGTTVWMNSGSRLIYPPKFQEKEREVYLEGEAYFDVAKNPGQPFFVRTDRFNVKAVGTAFNVQAYEKEKLDNVALVEGEVVLTVNNHLFSGAVSMRPNQIASLKIGDDHFLVENSENIKNQMSWIYGYLEFQNVRVNILVKRVSSYYDIKINMEENISQIRINGKLDLNDNPEILIDGVATIANLKYRKINDKTYTMYK